MSMTRPREHALNSAAPADGCAGLSILVSAWLAGIALTVLANTVVSADSRKRIPVEVLLFEVEEGSAGSDGADARAEAAAGGLTSVLGLALILLLLGFWHLR